MKLYKVTLKGMHSSSGGSCCNGIAYVISESMDEAYGKVKKYLDEKNWGFFPDRELRSVELIAAEGEYPKTEYRLYL